MSVFQAWHFINRILQVQGRILYLSLPIDSDGHCIRNANVKVLSESNFPIYGHNPRTYIGKYVSEKTCTFAYFTQCYIFHLLAQKRTDYCTRIIDITVNN